MRYARVILPILLMSAFTVLSSNRPATRPGEACDRGEREDVMSFHSLFSPAELFAAAYRPAEPSEVMVLVHDMNTVSFGVSNRGPLAHNIPTGQELGYWPAGTGNQYIFGMGVWIGGLADIDGDGTADTVVVQAYDPLGASSECAEGRVGQDTDDPLARVFSSTDYDDLIYWPDEFRNEEGLPIVFSPQDYVTIYNDISGEPGLDAGRAGIEIRQRSMAFTDGLTTNTIMVFFEIINRSDSLPDGPYTLEEAYVGFMSDMDVGDAFDDDMVSILDSVIVQGLGFVELNTGIVWDGDFDEGPGWEGKVGFAGVHFLQRPGDPWDGTDNDGDGIVDESPTNGIDDDGDGEIDDMPDEVDTVEGFHFTVSSNPSTGPPPTDPQSDSEAYRKLRCLTEDDCGEWGELATDVRFLISSGPFDLPPGESQVAGVAVIFADPTGDPDHIDFVGDPPRPDPHDSVFTEFIATWLEAKALYDSSFEEGIWDTVFLILGTTEVSDNNDAVGPYHISTHVIDTVPMARVTTHYSVDGGPFEEVVMEQAGDFFYTGDIPGQPFWSEVSYYIQAVDSSYQLKRDPPDAPESTFDFTLLDMTNFTGHPFEPCQNGVSVCPSDFDRDGQMDLFFLTQTGPALMRGTGGLAFDEVTDASGIDVPQTARGASWGDYDNDGFPDLFVGAFDIENSHYLYSNRGDGTFDDVTAEAGVSDTAITGAGVWADVDGDGWLDLFTVQSGADRLYINRGDGTFEEMAADLGIEESGSDAAAAFFDKDGDRDPDLLILSPPGVILYENTGGGFVDVTVSSGIDQRSWANLTTGDLDGDGDTDLIFTESLLTAFENTDGQGTFADVTDELGLSGVACRDASLVDINGDGLADIVTSTSRVLARKPGEGFTDLTSIAGLEGGVGLHYLALPFDFTGDGLAELMVDELWENAGYGGYAPRHWLGLLLEGTVSNRSAVGAVARVYAGDVTSHRWVTGGGGRSQDPPVLSFGLAEEEMVDSLVIDWPSGAVQRLTDFPVDQVMTVVEDSTLGIGDKEPTGPVLPRVTRLMQNFPNPFNPATTIRFDVPVGEGDGEKAGRVDVTLAVYDLRGRLVRVLIDRPLAPGTHDVVWDGRDERGERVPSGVYFSRLEAAGKTVTRKMLVAK